MEEQFIVSARKYRPQTFKDVVGQKAITDTLLNAIENNHLSQALSFTGPPGVVHPTCPRILARKIKLRRNEEPNNYLTVKVLESETSLNNSLDDLRILIDRVLSPPQPAKYMVYIVDVVHLQSQS